MVISYWDMVAGIVNRGMINDELFFDSHGEIWVVWDRMRSIVPTWRAAFKNPLLFHHIEETCKRLESWREKSGRRDPRRRCGQMMVAVKIRVEGRVEISRP